MDSLPGHHPLGLLLDSVVHLGYIPIGHVEQIENHPHNGAGFPADWNRHWLDGPFWE